jgi:hypothetical protein
MFRAVVGCVLVVSAGVSVPVVGQLPALEQRRVPSSLSSGELDNPARSSAVVFSRVVESPRASWMRLAFDRVHLERGSFLRLTSLRDRAVQHLNPRTLRQWDSTSAYFNGDAVLLEVVAGPRTRGNHVDLAELIVGEPRPTPEQLCGPEDDRVPSDDPRLARLTITAGLNTYNCSSAMYSADSCFVTAGHCDSAGALTVVEFDVPDSESSGAIVWADPADQYPVIPESVESRDCNSFLCGPSCPCGEDWALFRVYPNSETCLMPHAAQGDHAPFATTVPSGGEVIVTGYGIDDEPELYKTQQTASGPVVGTDDVLLLYQVDTQGANSGSPVLHNDRIVAVHALGGCQGSAANNAGMKVTHPPFQEAVDGYCPQVAPEVPCCAIWDMTVGCTTPPNPHLRVEVFLTDRSHHGKTLTLDVDGTPHDVQVHGDVAALAVAASSGPHTVTLVDPGDCQPPQYTTCQ